MPRRSRPPEPISSCYDNSAHVALETDGPPLPLPLLHIAEIVADEATRRGCGKLAILGTRWTMEGPVYAGACDRRGIGWAVPGPERREALHRIIMDELCLGEFRPESIALYERTIAEMADQGCDAAALVCTEIPLIVDDGNSPLPVLDSTRLLARAAVDVALGERPLPNWRGGPVAGNEESR